MEGLGDGVSIDRMELGDGVGGQSPPEEKPKTRSPIGKDRKDHSKGSL